MPQLSKKGTSVEGAARALDEYAFPVKIHTIAHFFGHPDFILSKMYQMSPMKDSPSTRISHERKPRGKDVSAR
jgi:hypothetical protein